MPIKPFTAADVSAYLGACAQADQEPSEAGMVAIECASLSGAESDETAEAVRVAYRAYAPAILAPTYTLIDAIHETDQINKATYFASVDRGRLYLIADSLTALQDAAKAARTDAHVVDSAVHISLTDSDQEEVASKRCGSC